MLKGAGALRMIGGDCGPGAISTIISQIAAAGLLGPAHAFSRRSNSVETIASPDD
jgi:hypothetical protein